MKNLMKINYFDRKCSKCNKLAFIPNLVTDLCQDCWEEQKFNQYYCSNICIRKYQFVNYISRNSHRIREEEVI